MKRICTITVRAGSKGVPGKNWKEIAGKPLFAYSIETAVRSKLFSAIVVSSDAEQILNEALHYGATNLVRRPEELCSDSAGKVPAIVHAVIAVESELGFEFDVVVDLDATSPLREVEDVLGAVSLLESSAASNVITATESRRSPYFNLIEQNTVSGSWGVSKDFDQIISRRQDVPKTFDMNASIYAWRREELVGNPKVFYESTKVYEMPQERSLDIDSEFDLKLVRWLLEERAK